MIGQKGRERRQMGYQKELMEHQYMNQERLNKQGHDLQMKMWRDTNYPAQMAMLKEAGLNPGLLYGQSGGGGTTAGSQGGGSAASGSAPNVPSKFMDLGVQLQAAELASRIDLAKSQAKKNEAEADKIAGVDTKEAETRIADLTQGIENKKAQYRLAEAQTEAVKLDNWITDKSKEDRVDEIKYTAKRALYDMGIARSEDTINASTIDDRIKMVGATAIGAVLNNSAIRKGIELDTAKIREISEGITQRWTEISQKGYGLSQKDREISQRDRELLIKQFEAELKSEMPGIGNFAGYMLSEISDIGAMMDDALYGTNTRRKKTVD